MLLIKERIASSSKKTLGLSPSCASLVASIARTHPHLSPCLSLSLSSLSRTSAVKFCWNLCTESAKRSGTYLGVFFPVYFGRRISSVFQVCGPMVHQEQSAEEMDERSGHRLARIQQHLQSGMSLCFPAKP